MPCKRCANLTTALQNLVDATPGSDEWHHAQKDARATLTAEATKLPEGWEWWSKEDNFRLSGGEERVCATSKEGYTVEVWNDDGGDFLNADGACFEAVEAAIARRRRDRNDP